MSTARLDINRLAAGDTEVARYRLSLEERVLIGRSAPGGTEILDLPVSGGGRSYRVDGGFHDDGVLAAFIEDYLRQAERLDCCPMGAEAIGAILGDTDPELAEQLMGGGG